MQPRRRDRGVSLWAGSGVAMGRTDDSGRAGRGGRRVDAALERALEVVADEIAAIVHGRDGQEDGGRGGRRRPVDVHALVDEVAGTKQRCDRGSCSVDVVGELQVDTDEDALRGLIDRLLGRAITGSCSVHVTLGPRSIVVDDEPLGPVPAPRPAAADRTAAAQLLGILDAADVAPDDDLDRLVRRLRAAIAIGRGPDGGGHAAVTLPVEALVRAG